MGTAFASTVPAVAKDLSVGNTACCIRWCVCWWIALCVNTCTHTID
jgi:hypothetical protein